MIDKLGFEGGSPSNRFLKADQFRIRSSAKDSSDPRDNGKAVRFIYNRTTGALSFDSDGIGRLAQTQFAKLSTGLAMTNQDIFVTSMAYSVATQQSLK